MVIWPLLPFLKHFYGTCMIRSSSGQALRSSNLQLGDMGQDLDFPNHAAAVLVTREFAAHSHGERKLTFGFFICKMGWQWSCLCFRGRTKGVKPCSVKCCQNPGHVRWKINLWKKVAWFLNTNNSFLGPLCTMGRRVWQIPWAPTALGWLAVTFTAAPQTTGRCSNVGLRRVSRS